MFCYTAGFLFKKTQQTGKTLLHKSALYPNICCSSMQNVREICESRLVIKQIALVGVSSKYIFHLVITMYRVFIG